MYKGFSLNQRSSKWDKYLNTNNNKIWQASKKLLSWTTKQIQKESRQNLHQFSSLRHRKCLAINQRRSNKPTVTISSSRGTGNAVKKPRI